MYMQDKERIKIDPIAGHINTQTRELFVGSEWGYPPFSYIAVEDKTYSNYRVLNELYPVLNFLQYGYDDRITLYLNIPRKQCNPLTLDFRTDVPDLETIVYSESQN